MSTVPPEAVAAVRHSYSKDAIFIKVIFIVLQLGIGHILQVVPLGRDPLVAPFKSIVADAVVLGIFKDVDPADPILPADNFKHWIDRRLNIPA
jgi:hypothetical protein